MADKEKYLQEAKNLYIKYCESYQSWQKAIKAFDSSRKVEDQLIKVKNITESLVKCTENLDTLSNKNSDETKRFRIMLAYALYCKLEWMCQDPQLFDEALKYYEKILCFLELYAKDPMVALVRFSTSSMVYTPSLLDDQRVLKVAQQRNDIIKTLEELDTEEKSKFWNGAEIFGVPADEQSYSFKQYQNEHHVKNLITGCKKNSTKVTTASMQLTENILKSLPSYSKITENLKSDSIVDNMQALNWINDRVNCLLNLGYFKQGHHLISIGFYYSVKIRRSLPPEARSSMDAVQGTLSGNFALYGLMLCTGLRSEVNGRSLKRNDEFTELVGCTEPGLEVYSSQFPVEYPNNFKEVKKILNRGIVWINRAHDLLKDYPEMLARVHCTKLDLKKLLTNYEKYF